MKKLCSAPNLPNAHLLRNLLEQAGIEARVFNENAQSVAGEFPIPESYPQLWVLDERHVERARQILEAFERMPAISATVRCTGCTEENPANFQVCWNCGAVLE